MNTYLAIFMVALFSSLVLTPTIRRLCDRWGWFDEPRDGRRVHQKPIPRLGGVAIYLTMLIALGVIPFSANAVSQALKDNISDLWIVLLPSTLVFLFGIYDDIRGADARLKFLVQGVAATLFFFLGGRIEGLAVPFVGSVDLPAWLGFVVGLIWIIGISNAFNLIDGMDGLAAGAALFASLVMLIASLMAGNPLVPIFALVLCGALISFLRYNFNPASIFLGDSGSLFIGFLLATLSVQGGMKSPTAIAVAIPIMAFGLPIIDTGFTIVRRFISGRPLFQGDREHIHHMLLERGWSQRRVAIVLYGVCALFAMLALLFVHDTGRTTGLVLFVVGAAVVLAVGRLRYHEVDEIKASMRRNLAERRLRGANNIRVRRASRAMSKADSLGELFNAVLVMLELGEFVYATVELNCNGDSARVEKMLETERKVLSLHGIQVREGLIGWSWERGDIPASEIIDSGRFWTLHLPLSNARGEWGHISLYRGFDSDALLLDINYLCDLFQREMSQAAERILVVKQEAVSAKPLAMSFTAGN